jgi:hypothetical protein
MIGLAWLANPIIWVGMFLLGKGARAAAGQAGTAAIGFALAASPLAVLFFPSLPNYLIWLASMVLVVSGAIRHVPDTKVDDVPARPNKKIDRLVSLYEDDC